MRRLAAVALMALTGCGAPTAPETGFLYTSDGAGALSTACWAADGRWKLETVGDSCCVAENRGNPWQYSFNGVKYEFPLVSSCEGGSR